MKRLSLLSGVLSIVAFAAALNAKNDINILADFATSAFSGGPDIWYTISTDSYPLTTPLSITSNRSIREGRVYPAPTGITIGEAGNYEVSVNVILQNPTEDSTILIPVFLVRNEEFSADIDPLSGGVVTLPYSEIQTLSTTNIVKDLQEGDRLSLVATNAGYPFPQPVTVVGWSITVLRIP